MLTPSAALSISDQVEKFGAYAGLAAVVGLAVLALLYFASAREVKRLREWADRAPERVADLEARIGEMARQRVVSPQPVGKAAAAKQVAKPATAAATAAAKPSAKAAAETGDGAAEPSKAGAKEGEDAVSEQDSPAVFDVVEEAPGDLTVIKKPGKDDKPAVGDQTLVSPGAGRALRQNKPSARPRSQPPVRPSTARLMESARASNAQRVAGGDPPGPGKPPGGEPDRKKLAIIGGVVAVLLAVVIVVTGVLGGGDDTPAPKTNAVPPATTTTPADETTINRANVEVAVLNGTTISGLAKGVADEITAGGFKRGEVRNGLDNTRAATIIEYSEGNRPAAVEVARTIDVGTDAVQPVQEGSRTLAPSAQVIVTVGADQTPQTG